jgi:two-component system, chemotaxis family, response regulator PixH
MAVLSAITVLLLDDNPLVLKIAKAILSKDGFHSLTASTWTEFNRILSSYHPDIIFLDVNLPGVTGDRLSIALKSSPGTQDIPVILISDLPESSLEALLPVSGADAWLRKPLTREKLMDMIRRFVRIPS